MKIESSVMMYVYSIYGIYIKQVALLCKRQSHEHTHMLYISNFCIGTYICTYVYQSFCKSSKFNTQLMFADVAMEG